MIAGYDGCDAWKERWLRKEQSERIEIERSP